MSRLTLVSHALCPYVQRAAIVLAEKGVAFERREVDLSNKPAWFLAVSPLGKTPVLLVDDVALFESAVICEYLEETLAPPLHPADALQRAQERAWIEFGSAVLNQIARFYNAGDEPALLAARDALAAQFAQLEARLGGLGGLGGLGDLGDGPWFAGERFGLVDAAFGPVFRYVDVFERSADIGVLASTPRMRAWRAALATRTSVRDAVAADYPQRLTAFLRARSSALSRRIAAQ